MTEHALSRMNIDYWYDVEHNAGRRAHEFSPRTEHRFFPRPPPIQIADVDDVCRLVDGAWRYESKRLKTIFAGGVPITLPAI